MRKVYLFLSCLLVAVTMSAQMPQQLPLEPKVRKGQLENGLTYFVASNSEPKGLGEFYIVQKVGSILEEENQRGLAHFLEHMAFNGTKNFPGKTMIESLEKIGVKFGANLNAYTAIDQTVYNISAVPVAKEENIDMCLLILHDWANELLLEEEEIDQERGVIREELRTRANAQQRMMEAMLPVLFPNNKYAHRLPGGLVEVVDNFKYQELRDYYEKWYRPDLQGIIVVGDFDVDAVEKKIISLFSDIEMPANAAERTIYTVEPNVEPLVAIAADPEATSTGLTLFYKKGSLPKEFRSTTASYVMNYMNSVVTSVLNTRLSDISRKPNAPFLGAKSSYGDFIVSNTMEAFEVSVSAKEGEVDKALTAVTHEIEKLRRFGINPSELERVKASFTSSYDRLLKEKDKLSNNYYVEGLVNHFLTGDAFPSVDVSYEVMQQIINGITLAQINEYAASIPTVENMAMALMMPKKEGLEIPTKEHLLAVYNKAKSDDVEPYQEKVFNEPLISKLPKAGKVKSVSKEPIGDATVWTLSNGAKVVLKKTDFKEDQILFSAYSKGGTSLFSDKDLISSKVIGDLVSLGGLGNYSNSDLGKMLAGKNASVGFKISTTTETMNGSCSPKDAETLMQLIHLGFTGLRQDNEAFESWKTRLETQLKNAEANPSTAFSDSLSNTLYQRNPMMKRFTADQISQIDYSKVMEHAKKRFSNAADFAFIFVGNIDEAALKPLVEKYIASLDGNPKAKEEWKVLDYTRAKGKVTNEFNQVMQNPKSTILSITSGNIPYSLENSMLATVTGQIFDLVFTRTIREEEQGTYGVSVKMNVTNYPEEMYSFSFNFDTDVALKDRLLKRAYTEIDNVVKEGIDSNDLNKILEYMLKSYDQSIRTNDYWLSSLGTKYLVGKDYHTTYKSTLEGITPEKVNNFIKTIFNTNNRVEVIMNGVAK